MPRRNFYQGPHGRGPKTLRKRLALWLATILLGGCAEPVRFIETAGAPRTPAAVDRYVNREMWFTPDGQDVWRTDCWGQGDCEDFALCKARLLLAAGYNPSRLTLLVVLLRKTQVPHAALAVDGVVYDNIAVNSGRTVGEYLAENKPYYTCNFGGTEVLYAQGVPVSSGALTNPKCLAARRALGLK